MEHQYKNPNKQLATAQNRNQTALVANSQDLQTMELVDQQDVAGNDFVAEQLPVYAPMAMTAAPASVSPWDMNLFAASQKGISDVEWAKDSKTTHDLKGKPHTGAHSVYKDKGSLAKGKHGEFTYQNDVQVRRMTGGEASYDVDKLNTQERSAKVDGISVTEKAHQQYLGGGHYVRGADTEPDKGVYGGIRTGTSAKAKAAVENGTLTQSRSNDYAVDAKRENGVTTAGVEAKGKVGSKLKTTVGNVDRVEERVLKGGASADLKHSDKGFAGKLAGNVARTRSQNELTTQEDGSTVAKEVATGQQLSGSIKRSETGKITVAGKAGVDGSISRQSDSVDAQGRTITNNVYAKGSADIAGSHSSSSSKLDASAKGELGASRDVAWQDTGGEHKQTMSASLGGEAVHDVLKNTTDLRTDLSANRTDQTVQAINENRTQTRTLDQGLTGGATASLSKGVLDKSSVALNGGYNIAHTKEDAIKEGNEKKNIVVTHKGGVNGALDQNQRTVGASYGFERSNKTVVKEGNTTTTNKSNVGVSTSGEHDFLSDKSNLKGAVSYTTGSSNRVKVDDQMQTRSGYQHDIDVGGSLALEQNAQKIGSTTKKVGYGFTTTQGKTTEIDGRKDSIDHTNKTGVKVSDGKSGLAVGLDHDYTREKESSWIDKEKKEEHSTNNKLTVGGGVKHNLKTEDLDIAARLGMATGHSITKQVDDLTKQTQGVSHSVNAAVKADVDSDKKSTADSSIQGSYAFGTNNSIEKKTDTGKEINSSSHEFNAQSGIDRKNQNLDLSYVYGTGKVVETDTGSKEENFTHKIGLGAANAVADKDAKAESTLRAGYDLSHSEKEVIRDGSDKVTKKTTNGLGGEVGYNVQDKKFSTGIHAEYKSEKEHKDGSKIISKQENSASINQDGKAKIARKTEDVGYEKVTNPTDEMRVKTQKGVFSSEISASTQKDASKDRSLSLGGKVGYSAFQQDYSFKAKALSTKVSGLHQGDRDVDGQDRVRTLQKSLNKAGERIEVNGIFDAATTAAVQKFQKSNGLAITQQGEIDARTAALLPEVRMLPEGTKFDASVEAGKVSADANIKSTFKADQVKVEGVAGAKVTMVGGNAKIAVPVFNWGLGGEQMAVTVTAGVNAELLAEANGNIKLDVGKSDKGINAHIEGGGKAFVGARAGVEVGAEVEWKKNSAQHYGDLIKRFASSLPGTWDDHLINRVPQEIWPQLAQILVGSGSSTLMYARAGVEGQAGLGAEATFNAGIKNGMIEASGSFGGSFGLGGSAKTSVGLHAVDGVRLGGVLAMKGTTWLADTLPGAKEWLKNVEVEMQKRIDNYLEEKKKQGGIRGFFAKAVDFVGDDVFNLW